MHKNPLFCCVVCIYIGINFGYCLCCHAQEECDANVESARPRALLNGQFVTVDESRFSKHYYSFPPSEVNDTSSNGDDSVLHYFVLNEEKPVLYVPNFLNQSVAEELKEFCISGGRFVRSPTRDNTGDAAVHKKDAHRTSESCTMVPTVMYRSNPKVKAMLSQDPLPPNVAKIGREMDITWDVAVRASQILGLNANVVEPLQLVRYTSPGAQYKVHHDHGGYYGKLTEIRPWTMLVFLNSVPKGGHTAFPKLNLEIVPRFGDAVIWKNVKNGEGSATVVDADMVHAGKPPASNVHKYAMNVWFGQESSEERVNEGKW